jgi:hypothetical protein
MRLLVPCSNQQIPIHPVVSISLISVDWRKSYTGHNFFHLPHHF